MAIAIIQVLVLFASSAVTLAITYYRISIPTIQQITAALVVLLLLLFRKFIASNHKGLQNGIILLFVFLISLFLQLLIFSSGGFYSPLLILLHLFTIGLSFLLNLRTAISFLVFALVVLSVNTLIDARLQSAFFADPWSLSLYSLSFIILGPLYYFVASTYHLKDVVSKFMSNQLELTKRRDESLWMGLSDIVFVTDTKLNLLSANDSAKQFLHITESDIAGKNFFDLMKIKDLGGSKIDAHYLSIEQAAEEKTTHIINNLLLYGRESNLPKEVSIQVRPLTNLEGLVDQIILVIAGKEGLKEKNILHQDLEKVVDKHEADLVQLKNELKERGLEKMKTQIDLIGRSEKDLKVATEIADHGIKPKLELVDMVRLVQEVVAGEKELAASLGVRLNFTLGNEFLTKFTPDFVKEGEFAYPEGLTSQYFAVLTDAKWIKIMVQKLLDLAVLIGSGSTNSEVKIELSYSEKDVNIDLMIPSQPLASSQLDLLFIQSYGTLVNGSNLKYGSGLEGYLAKTIASLFNLSVQAQYLGSSSALHISVQVPKAP